jgi:hypothetical protein
MSNPLEFCIQDALDALNVVEDGLWDEVTTVVRTLAVHCPPELGRDTLIDAVWGAIGRYGGRTLDTFIGFLREADRLDLSAVDEDSEPEPPSAA